MDNSNLLNMKTKASDNVICENCHKGHFIPEHPEVEINHGFHCSYCGEKVNLDGNVVVE